MVINLDFLLTGFSHEDEDDVVAVAAALGRYAFVRVFDLFIISSIESTNSELFFSRITNFYYKKLFSTTSLSFMDVA